MYLPEEIILNDFRNTFEQQTSQNPSSPYYPHFCNFIFKINPLIIATKGYVESEEKIVEKFSWKIFVKGNGKGLYPYMIVGIVDHNNVEEISYKITLKGIKSEYDEKRQNIVKINAEENRKLWCNKKIWYRSLFDDIPKNFDEQMPLLTFKVSIKYRCSGEIYIPNILESPYHPYHSLHERRSNFSRKSQQQQLPWISSSSLSNSDDTNFNSDPTSTLIFFAFIYLSIIYCLEIDFLSSIFYIFCYLLSFVFTLVFSFFDLCLWILFFPATHFLKMLNFYNFFFNPSFNDTVNSSSSSFKVATNLFGEKNE